MRRLNWSSIHDGRDVFFATPLLTFLSFLYGLAIKLRLLFYKNRPQKTLPCFVLSIGNLTTGGTGKTPATCMVAKWAVNEGYNTAILSRGYGGRYHSKVFIISDSVNTHADADLAGDEPLLLARKLDKVPVILSRNRHLAGLEATRRFNSELVLLDDGFQHIELKRDLNILLMDAFRPFGNGYLLPRGPLREPVDKIERADIIIFTRSSQKYQEKNIDSSILERIKSKPVFHADHFPDELMFPHKNMVEKPDSIRGKRVCAFAGIARPDVFESTLIELGAEIIFFKGYRDHYRFSREEIQELMAIKQKEKADYLITTEKDWIRMEGLSPELHDLAYLTIRFAIVLEEDQFFNIIREKMNSMKGRIIGK